MANKYLDYNGLAYLWEKIKSLVSTKVDKETGKGLSSNDYTTAEKTKLSGIATGAQANVIEGVQVNGTSLTPTNKIVNVPAMTGASSSAAGSQGVVPAPAAGKQDKFLRGDGSWEAPENTTYGVVSKTANGLAPKLPNETTTTKYLRQDGTWAVPPNQTYSTMTQAQATEGTETTGKLISAKVLHDSIEEQIPGEATTSAAGLMSSADKTKLNGVATGAEVNQNAFSNVKVGSTTIAADGKTDTLELVAGTNITLTPDATNDKVTIAASGVTPASATPKMDGTGAVGTSVKYAREDHVHPSDTKKVDTALIGAANGIAPLDANAKIGSEYLPSYVDDVIEAYPVSGATALSSGWLSATSGGAALTPEAGKIYVLMTDSGDYAANTQFRWSGTTYVKLSDGGVSSITNAEIDTICAA